MDFLEFFSQIPTAAYIFFAAGIILAAAELYAPGFGICGVGSLLCFGAAIVMGARSFAEGVVFTTIVLVVAAVLILLFCILASRGKFVKPLVLKDRLGTQEGFSSSPDFSFLLAQKGFAQSVLRPAGRAQIGGIIYDVVASGEFIEPGTPVQVIEVSGAHIVVTKSHV